MHAARPGRPCLRCPEEAPGEEWAAQVPEGGQGGEIRFYG